MAIQAIQMSMEGCIPVNIWLTFHCTKREHSLSSVHSLDNTHGLCKHFGDRLAGSVYSTYPAALLLRPSKSQLMAPSHAQEFEVKDMG